MAKKVLQTHTNRSNPTPGEALSYLISDMREILPFDKLHLAVGGRWFPRNVTPEEHMPAVAAWRLNWFPAPFNRWRSGSVRVNGRSTTRRDYRLKVGSRQWHIVLLGVPADSPEQTEAEALEEITELLHSVLTPTRTEQLFNWVRT